MDRTKTLAGIVALSAAFAALAACDAGRPAVRVGSKNFTEQVVLGEIIAQHLEHRLGDRVHVERNLNLGGALLVQQGLVSGDIDLYPEYTGTALTGVLKQPSMSDPGVVLAKVRAEYASKFHVDWLDPLGIDNTFAMVVRGSDARSKHLANLTDAAAAGTWNLGVGYEFEQRPDGLPALESIYHLRTTGAPKTMDLGLLYKALQQNEVDMVAGSATDGVLSKLDAKILSDDRRAFPPYQACIVVREATLAKVPGLRQALLELSGKFTNQTMQKLNYAVDGEHRAATDVASEFLKQAGLR